MNISQISSSFSGGSKRSRLALRVAMWGIGISVAVVTLSQLIVSGFRTTIQDKLTSMIAYAHIVENNPIFVTSNMTILDDDQLLNINSVIAPQEAQAVVEAQVVAQKGSNTLGMLLVGAQNDKIPNDKIRLSKTSARLLDVKVDDVVNIITFTDQPSIVELVVDSIYSSDIVEIETSLGYVSFETSQQLALVDSLEVDYYLVQDPVPIEKLREVAEDEGLVVQLAEDRAPHVYSWLSMIDQNMTLIFIIMAIVAIINVVTATLIVIVDNMPKIGTLRALGMRSSTVRRLFVGSMGWYVVKGALIGLTIALAIGAAQYFFEVIRLDSEAYYMSVIPISFDFLKIGLYAAGVVLIVVMSILLPVTIISKLSIAKSIKYE